MGICIVSCPKTDNCTKWFNDAVRVAVGGVKNGKFEKGIKKRIQEQKEGFCGPHTDAWDRHDGQMKGLKIKLDKSIKKFEKGGECQKLLKKSIPKEVRAILNEPLPDKNFKGRNYNDKKCKEQAEKDYQERKQSQKKVQRAVVKGAGALAVIGIAVIVTIGTVGIASPATGPSAAAGGAVVAASTMIIITHLGRPAF